MAIQKVGVVGCGLMGSGIAQVCAAAGFETVVREVAPEVVEKGIKGIEKNLARLVEKGTITEAQKGEIRGRLKGTTAIEDLKDCDLIIEAIIEQLPAKRELFAALDALCPAVHDFCEQHVVADDHGNLHGDEAAATICRAALFQSRAGDEAGGSGADDCDRSGGVRRDGGVWRESWERRRCARTTARDLS